MTFDRRHLRMMLVVAACAIAYTVWIVARPTPRPQGSVPMTAGAQPVARARAAVQEQGIDPAAIPVPPQVDLVTPPTWARNPFAAPQAAAAARASAEAPALADPVVRSILYSAQRRAALVDQRIVGVGDRVGAGRVVAIERDAIIVETSVGERRRFALRGHESEGGGQ